MAVAALSALAAPSISLAADSSVAFNAGVVTDYRYRGISQTRLKPALQGGVDYTAGAFYLGAWGSTIKWIKDNSTTANPVKGPVELDIYGGYKFSAGDVGVEEGVGFVDLLDLFFDDPDGSGDVFEGGGGPAHEAAEDGGLLGHEEGGEDETRDEHEILAGISEEHFESEAKHLVGRNDARTLVTEQRTTHTTPLERAWVAGIWAGSRRGLLLCGQEGGAVGEVVGEGDEFADAGPEVGEVLVDVAGEAVGDFAAALGVFHDDVFE